MTKQTPKTDIIIPLYKPGEALFSLLERLESQTVPVNRILLVNTERKYFDELICGTGFAEKYGKLVSVYHISKEEFDHGGTRRFAVSHSDAEVFVMMTQDALPADNYLLENLLEALSDAKTAAAYAQQLPAKDCRFLERFMRRFNYPEESRVKGQADLQELGIKTYFCSNVCAAYKRSVYDELGGFVKRTIFNEDMLFAAGAIKAGYTIAYEAKARVLHSHNYTIGQQFHRNFDLGVSQAEHPEVFRNIPSEKEGKKMVLSTTAHLFKSKKYYLLPYFYLQCAGRYTGYFLGKHYKALPLFFIIRCTDNKQYWEKHFPKRKRRKKE